MRKNSGVVEAIKGVKRGDIASVSRALTLASDGQPEADELLRAFFQELGRAQKIGLCGPPGVGKSSLASRLISLYRKRNLKVGMLAVDPSSPISGGSFLGDRLRIQEHVGDKGVFIRSIASRGMVGGLSDTIFSQIHVLEAYGCDKIIIETVGIGQDEVAIARAVDSVVYVTTPQLGDEIQAMKAGVMEVGDLFVVNKADLEGKDKAVSDIRSALGLGRSMPLSAQERLHHQGEKSSGVLLEVKDPQVWEPPVLAVSARDSQGLELLIDHLDRHEKHLKETPEGRQRLKNQCREELSLYVSRRLFRDFLSKVSEKDIEGLVDHKVNLVDLASDILGSSKGQTKK